MKLLDHQAPCFDGLDGIFKIHTAFGAAADFQVLAADQDLAKLIVLHFVQHLADNLGDGLTCGIFVSNVAGGLDLGRELEVLFDGYACWEAFVEDILR